MQIPGGGASVSLLLRLLRRQTRSYSAHTSVHLRASGNTMQRALGAVLLVVCLQAMTVTAGPPDWISEEILEMVAGDKARCMSEHGTTEALIEEVNNGHLPNDRAITCYMFCLFEAFSLVDDDGELEVEMLVGFLPEHMQATANELIDLCSKESGSDVCDKMYKMAKCVQEKRPDLWFML